MPLTPYFLGIDVGTTSVKVVLYDPVRGKGTHIAARPTPVQHPRPGWAEWDPAALWDTVARTVRDAVTQVESPTRIQGIGLASVGEAGLALDEKGHPLHPMIAWFDPRGEEYVAHWWAGQDVRHLYLITGHFPRSLYTAFKLLWLKEHQPEVWSRLAHWLFVGDYVAYLLTGRMATVPTLAARSFLFDVVHRRWSEPLLEEIGLRPVQMPPIIPSTEPLGNLQDAVARDLGLPSGIPVALGGHDHVVGMWSAGIDLPGRAVDSSGTAQGIATRIPRFIGEAGYDAQLTCYPLVAGNAYILQGGMPTAGAALQWLADLIAGGDVGRLLAWAENAPPGSRGVGALPFLRGAGPPYRHADMRALFYHLDLATGPPEIARGLIEGLACFTRDVIELLEQVSKHPVQEVRAIGGANRSSFVLRVKASMLGRAFVHVDIPETVGTGAALLAGIASGNFSTPEEALASLHLIKRAVLPIPEWQDVYEEVFRRYKRWVSVVLETSER